jgi:hypothetical protein
VIIAAATSGETSQQFHLKIVVGSGNNIEDVSLVAMDTSTSSTGLDNAV